MTMEAREIIAEFERREAAEGGPAKVDAKEVLIEMARDLALPYERVRAVLLDHWGGMIG